MADDDRRGERDVGSGLLVAGRRRRRRRWSDRSPGRPDRTGAPGRGTSSVSSWRWARRCGWPTRPRSSTAGSICRMCSPRSFGSTGAAGTPPCRRRRAPRGDLVRHGALVRDPVVTAVLRGDRPGLSHRTVERRFRAATGLTRAPWRRSTVCGPPRGCWLSASSSSTSSRQLGYYDEPHLARLLLRYVGRSAQQLRTGAGGALALDPAQYTTS